MRGDALFHWLYGLHSQIPACCIRAFIAERARVGAGAEYAVCSRCARRQLFSPVHRCHKDSLVCRFFIGWACARSRRSSAVLIANGWRAIAWDEFGVPVAFRPPTNEWRWPA